jgi:hypothetical protein
MLFVKYYFAAETWLGPVVSQKVGNKRLDAVHSATQ